jgi:class 3 adenylate cyclase
MGWGRRVSEIGSRGSPDARRAWPVRRSADAKTVLIVDVARPSAATAAGAPRWSPPRHRPRQLATAGRSAGATASSPAPTARRAVAFAQRAINTVGELGLVIRVGVHTGEVELVRDKLEGVAVHVGARITAEARPSEVLVSGIVKTSRWQLSAARLSERARIGLAP